jgi:hypothetical protein
MAGGVAIPRHKAEGITKSGRTDFGETVRRQFRQVMARLTQPAGPKVNSRKRRSEDVRGGFQRVAILLIKRTMRAVHIPPASWDTLTWMRHWEFEESAPQDETFHASAQQGTAQETTDLSPRL